MIIRDYEEKDYEQLVEMIDEFNSYIASIDTKKLVRDFKNRDEAKAYTDQSLKDAHESDGFCYVAEENDRMVGFIQGIVDKNDKDMLTKLSHVPFYDGWIGEFYVKPELRGTGLGSELIDKAYAHFRSKNCRHCCLLVLCDNKNAIDIYKTMGFENRYLDLIKEL
jgi:ribosomal protein S18 acetylase RimI-like enzyme